MNIERSYISYFSRPLYGLIFAFFLLFANTLFAQFEPDIRTEFRDGKYYTEIHVTACDSYGWIGGTETESQNGKVKESYTKDEKYDSIVTLYLDLRKSSLHSDVRFACDSFKWVKDTVIKSSVFDRVTEATYQTKVGKNVVGCDSTETLKINMGNSTEEDKIQSHECDTFIWRSGNRKIYTESNYTDTVIQINDQGCPKVVTLKLTLYKSTRKVLSPVECDAYSWYMNNDYVSVNRSYTESILDSVKGTNVVGCDSTVVLNLTINKSDTIRTDTAVCDTFTWYANNTKYNTSNVSYNEKTGQYYKYEKISQGKNRFVCDSFASLNLVLHTKKEVDYYDVARENDLPVDVFGLQLYRDTANALINGKTIYNCDSIVNYSLTVYWNVHDTIDTVVCSNELPFVWHKETHNIDYPAIQDTVLLYHAENSNPVSDTYYVAKVHLRQAYDSNFSKEFCLPNTYTFNSHEYSTAMTDSSIVEWHYTKLYHCDSTITLHLTLHDTLHEDVYQSIVLPQLPFTTSGLPEEHTFTADQLSGGDDTLVVIHTTDMYSCDSTVYYHLTVTANPTSVLDSTICENDLPLSWNHRTFTDEGTLFDTIPSTIVIDGVAADSIITMRLHVKRNSHNNFDTTVHEIDLGYSFNGYKATSAVTNHPISLPEMASNGCDSIIHYTVKVLPNIKIYFDTFVCTNMFPLVWHDSTFTGMANKSKTFVASSGVDSTITLRMHVYESSDVTIDSAVCKGAVVSFAGHSFDTSVFYTDSCINYFGCDSVSRLRLFVDTARYDTVSQEIVENQLPYTFLTRVFTDDDFVDNDTIIEDVIGFRATHPYCDSNVHYQLVVHKNVDTVADSSICYSQLPFRWDSYTFYADSLYGSKAGVLIYNDSSLKTMYGADSILVKRLHVNATYIEYDTINHCLARQDEPVYWRHTILPAGSPTGDYILDTFSMFHCDSLFRLRLELRTNTSSTVWDTIVENQIPYEYDLAHNYIFTKPISDSLIHIDNRYGCDSAVTYSLTVFWNVEADAFDTICFSSLPYVWNEQIFYASSLTDEPHRTGDIIQQALLLAHTGADSLLTMYIHVNPTFDTMFYDTICDDSTYSFNGAFYSFRPGDNKDFRHDDTLRTYLNCDSVSSIMLRVWPTYDTVEYDTVFSYLLPILYGPYECDTIGTYHFGTRSTHGCDSLNTMHLWIVQVTFVDTSVCNNHVPFEWHTKMFNKTKIDTLTLSGIHGEDSLIVMDVTVLDTSSVIEAVERCDTYTWQDNITYTRSTTAPYVTYTNIAGCDSVVHLDLSLYYSIEVGDHISVCNSHTWIDGVTYTQSIYGPQKMLRTIHNCDSLVTLELFVAYSTYDEILDSMCLGGRYNFRGRVINRAGTYFDSLYTAEGCDSVTVLHLAELPTPLVEVSMTRDCDEHEYTITSSTDVDYFRWSSVPEDPTLAGQESSAVIKVRPTQEISYYLYVDYIEDPRCPTTTSVTLAPLNRPTATLRTSPDFLTYNNMKVKAYDIGEVYDNRNWYINGFMQSDHELIFEYDADLSLDSVRVMLEVDNGLCRDSAYSTIMVRKPTLFLPDAFTPYLSTNNIFKAQGRGILEFEIFIYNRVGQLVFTSRDINEGWDGKHNGVFCTQGNYVYTIRYRDIATPNSYQEITGSVLLLR